MEIHSSPGAPSQCGSTEARGDPACGLGSSLLPIGDAIPTKKRPPSPSSFGHQYRKFSLEGTAGPAVMPLGRFSLILVCPRADRLSDAEQAAGAVELILFLTN